MLRRHLADLARRRLWSWHARTLSTWIAVTIPMDPDSTSSPTDLARMSVYLDTEEKAELEWAASLDGSGPSGTENSGWKPGDPAEVRESRPGSAEALMGMMRGGAM